MKINYKLIKKIHSYAFLLDILAISLIVFTITGIIMWFHLLKKDKWAWVIFVAGFVYFGFT
ncbi:MAG: hypothetical protein KDD15_33780, partial [Lewinella sp.]|nr:hypothetical protein [Lewinella sp.]